MSSVLALARTTQSEGVGTWVQSEVLPAAGATTSTVAPCSDIPEQASVTLPVSAIWPAGTASSCTVWTLPRRTSTLCANAYAKPGPEATRSYSVPFGLAGSGSWYCPPPMVVVSTTWPVPDSSAATLLAPNAAPVTKPRGLGADGIEMLGENW